MTCWPLRLLFIGVQVNIRIHRLNIHLVRVAGKPVVLRIVAHPVFNQGFFKEFQNNPVILRVHLNLKCLYSSFGFRRGGLDYF